MDVAGINSLHTEQYRVVEGSCGIAVMAKASMPGRTKTRLTPPLTAIEAAAFNTAFLKDVSANLLAASQHVPLNGYMAYGPPGSQQFFVENLPHEIRLIEAWLPAFGECLLRAITDLFAAGHRAAIVLNSDSPTLPTGLLIEAARMLARPGDHAVLGPSTDGGYYLLGVKQVHRRLFEDIDWSTEHVARQTLERAAEIGLPVHCLLPWYDIDDVDSLRQLHAELFNGLLRVPMLAPFCAPHSAALMRELLGSANFHQRIGLDLASTGRLAS